MFTIYCEWRKSNWGAIQAERHTINGFPVAVLHLKQNIFAIHWVDWGKIICDQYIFCAHFVAIFFSLHLLLVLCASLVLCLVRKISKADTKFNCREIFLFRLSFVFVVPH